MASTSRSRVAEAAARLRRDQDVVRWSPWLVLALLLTSVSGCGTSSTGDSGTFNEAPDVNYNFGQDTGSTTDSIGGSGDVTPTADAIAADDSQVTEDSSEPSDVQADTSEPDTSEPDTS